jgi:hypothetical protein
VKATVKGGLSIYLRALLSELLLLVDEDWAALENEFEIYSKWSGLLVPSRFKNPIRELRGDH